MKTLSDESVKVEKISFVRQAIVLNWHTSLKTATLYYVSHYHIRAGREFPYKLIMTYDADSFEAARESLRLQAKSFLQAVVTQLKRDKLEVW